VVCDDSGTLLFILKAGTGSRLAKSCGSGSAYFSSIDACVPSSISGLGAFVSAFGQKKTCHGGVIASSSDLEALRYCNVINGNLTISVSDGSADYTALYDISVITGLRDGVLLFEGLR